MNPKFIEHIYLDIKKPPLPARLDDSGETLMIAEQIAVRSVEAIEDAIVREITHMALEEGIDRVYLLDKKNIVSALEKQIPKKPIDDRYPWCICPVCGGSVYLKNVQEHIMNLETTHCEHCGQKLDWGDGE